jgi:hypothetical protein
MTTQPSDKPAQEANQGAASVRWGRRRWWHVIVYQLFWPTMLLGTLYAMLFFFLNSSLFTKVLTAQMNGMFEGKFSFERVRIGPAFNRLDISGVRIEDPSGVEVIAAREVRVRYELKRLLLQLINDSYLELPDIEVEGAKVSLDFSVPGRFNLTQALGTGALPTPPPPEPGTFRMALSKVNLYDSQVFLDFGLFTVDLRDLEVRQFSLGIDAKGLSMDIPAPQAEGDHPGMEVGYGTVRFNPKMFGFTMGKFGAQSVGLLLDGGGGVTGGALAQATVLAAAALRGRPRDPEAAARYDAALSVMERGALSPRRGALELPLGRLSIEGFWWRGAKYGFARAWMPLRALGSSPTDPDAANQGLLQLGRSMMDLSPKGLPVDDPIGYEASLDLRLLPDSALLKYFLGDAVVADAPIDLAVAVHGDLSRADGQVALSAPALRAFGVAARSVALNATLAGQAITLDRFTARALDGDIWARGQIALLDGDMNIEVAAGQHPGIGRAEGLDLSSLLPPALRSQWSGRLTAHLRLLSSKPRGLGVALLGPITFDLDTPLPYSGAARVVLRQGLPAAPGKRSPPSDDPDGALLRWRYQVLHIHDALTITADTERVILGAGLVLRPDTLRFSDLKVQVSGENLGRFSSLFGVSDLSTGPFSVKLDLTGEPLRMHGSASVRFQSIRYLSAYHLRSFVLDARLAGDTIHLDRLELDSPLGELNVRGSAKPFMGALNRVRADIPFDLDVVADRLVLADIGALVGFPIRGDATFNARVHGSTKKPLVDGGVEVNNLKVMGEAFKAISARFTLDERIAKVQSVRVLHGEGAQEDARLDLDAEYNLLNHTFRVDAHLHKVRAHEIPTLKAMLPEALGLRGQLDIDLKAEGDTDSFLGGRIERRFFAEGNVILSGLAMRGMDLGDIQLNLYTHDEVLQVNGHILNLLKLTAHVDSWRPLSAQAELSFYRLSVMDVLERYKPLLEDPAPPTTSDDALLGLTTNGKALGAAPLPAAPVVASTPFAGGLVKALDLTGVVRASLHERTGLSVSLELERIHAKVMKRTFENREPILMAFRDDTLTIHHLDIGTGDYQLNLDGTVDTGGALDLDVHGQIDMSLLQMLGDAIPKAAGSLDVELYINGDILREATPADPGGVDLKKLEVLGEVKVGEPILVELRALPPNEPLELRSGSIAITDKGVMTRSGKALQLRALGGSVDIDFNVNLDHFQPLSAKIGLSANNLSYHVPGTAMVKLDIPTLTLRADDLKRMTPDNFKLTGDIRLVEGRFYQDFNVQQDFLREQVFEGLIKGESNVARADVSLMRKVPILQLLAIDLKISAPDSFVVDNTIAGAKVDLELGFDLNAQGPLRNNFSELNLKGDVSFKEGSIVFRGRKFAIQSSSQVSFNGGLEPRLDIAANAEIDTQQNLMSSVVGSTNLDRRRQIRPSDIARASRLYIITLALVGKLSDLEITLESNPFLPTNDILTLIITGQTLDQISASGDDSPAFSMAFQALIAPFVEAQIGKAISADALKFTIAGGAAQLMYIQQLTNKLRIAGGVSLAGADSNQMAIGAEYKFFDNLSIETTGQSESNQGTTLNLRLRYHQSLD